MRFRQATGFIAVAVLATTFVFLGSGAASADSTSPTTSTALTLSANVISPGDPVTLTAVVTGVGNPTGTVQFNSAGSSPIGGPVTLTPVTGSSTASQASVTTTSFTTVGTYTITATFKTSSITNFFNSTSAGETLIVSATPIHTTTTTLTSNPSGTVPYDQPVTFTAHVAENDGGTMIPTGTVAFNDITTDPSNPILLGSATLDASGNATIVSTGFLSNPHVISASYYGDGSNQSSATSITVLVAPQQSNQLATTTTSVSLSPSEITVGDSTTISAQVSPAPTAGEVISFSANGNSIGRAPVDANGVATLGTVGGWGDGSYDIQASYPGDDVDLPSSGDATLTVDAETSSAVPTVTTLTVAPSPITAAQTTTFFAHVVQNDGVTLPPAGELVTFTADGNVEGQVPLDASGNASLVVSGWTEGTYDIQASYGGDTFDAPSSDDATLTVTAERLGPPAPLTVTAPAVSMTYGAAVPTLPAPSYDGFVEGDTAASLSTQATCTTTATSTSPVGTYPVTCTGATDVNYAITYVGGTLTVNPAGVTVTAPVSTSMTYGAAVPTFAAPTYSGFVNTDTAASLTSVATCTSAATSSSPVGSYPVTCAGASDPNYTFSYVVGNLSITKAPLTVSAPTGVTMTFGASVPTLTPTYSGFVHGDSAGSLTSAPVCTTTATSASSVGSYPVTCSSAASSNYTFTYVASSLSVTKAPLTVTGPSPSMTYGGTVPTIGVPTYSGFVNGNTTSSLTSLATCTATVTRTSPAGSYPVTCSGAAGANYTFSYVAGQITVGPAALTVTAPSPSVVLGATVPTLTPTFTGFLNGDTAASLTTPPVCTTTATSSSPLGSYPVTCSSATAANYTISYVAGTLTVTPAGKPTTLTYTGPTTGHYRDPVTLSATLATGTTPVSGANVTLSLGSQSCTAVTSSAGGAICLLILSQPSGTYPVTATFAATSVYQGSTATTSFTITPKATSIYAFFSGPASTGSQVTLSAWLTENLIIPVPNETVTLSLGSRSCTAVTGFLGLAQCSLTVAGPLGPTTATAAFAGDSSFAASSDSNSALVYAYPPGGGSFVIGDRSASGTVTFFGSQWSKANRLSGSSAPSTFKGFASSPSTPGVGDRWSTGSSANPTPPAGPLPTYMAVVVASSAGKSGSSITGDVANIAIVKTNPGYSPSGTGTGTVVATLD